MGSNADDLKEEDELLASKLKSEFGDPGLFPNGESIDIFTLILCRRSKKAPCT